MAKIPCPHCGKLVDRLVEGMCEDCYTERHPLVVLKDRYVTRCKYCGAVYLKGRWVKYKDLDQLYRRVIYEKGEVRGEIKSVNIEEDEDFAVLQILAEGAPHPEIKPRQGSYNLEIYFRNDICTSCRELLTKKETAVIQIRSTPRGLDEDLLKKIFSLVEQELFKWKDKKGAISDIKKFRHGVDIHVTSQSFARHLAYILHQHFPSYVIESAKAVGIRDGRRIYHMTYSIRLVTYRPGDVVKIEGSEKVVLEVTNRYVGLQDVKTKKYEQWPISEFLGSNVLLLTED